MSPISNQNRTVHYLFPSEVGRVNSDLSDKGLDISEGSFFLEFPDSLESMFHLSTVRASVKGIQLFCTILVLILLFTSVIEILAQSAMSEITRIRLPCCLLLCGVFLGSYNKNFKHMNTLAILFLAAVVLVAFGAMSVAAPSGLNFFYASCIGSIVVSLFVLSYATFKLASFFTLMGLVCLSLYWATFLPDHLMIDWMAWASVYCISTVAGLLAMRHIEQSRRQHFLKYYEDEPDLLFLDQGQVDTDWIEQYAIERDDVFVRENILSKICSLSVLDPECGISDRTSFDRVLRVSWRSGSGVVGASTPISIILIRCMNVQPPEVTPMEDNDISQELDATAVVSSLLMAIECTHSIIQLPDSQLSRFQEDTLALLFIDMDPYDVQFVQFKIQQRLQEASSAGFQGSESGVFPCFRLGSASSQLDHASSPNDLVKKAEASLALS